MNWTELCSLYQLNDTDRKILACIRESLSRPDARTSIREVARQSFVSTTTVVRLAGKLGYRGYSDMMYAFRRRIAEERGAEPGEDASAADPAQIEAFVEGIWACRDRCIFVCGMGNSAVTAGYIAKRLSILGIAAYDGSPYDVLRSDAKPSVAILISKRGEASELTRIAAFAREMGHGVYLMTANPESRLAAMSDCCLAIRADGSAAYAIPDFFVGRSIIVFEHVLAGLWRRMKPEKA